MIRWLAVAAGAALSAGCLPGGVPSYSTLHAPASVSRPGLQAVVAAEAQKVTAFEQHAGTGEWSVVPELETAFWYGGRVVDVGLKIRWIVGPSIPELGLRYQRTFGAWSIGAAPSLSYHLVKAEQDKGFIWRQFDGNALAAQLPILISYTLSERRTLSFGPKLLYQRERSSEGPVGSEWRTAGVAGGAYAALYSRIGPRTALAVEVNGYMVGYRQLFRGPFWQAGLAWLYFPGSAR